MRAAHTRAVEALRKFAAYPLEEFGAQGEPDDRGLFRANDWQLTVGDIKRARAALAAVDAEPCACKDRPLSQCPGEWEPGCDLGRNEKYVVPVQEPVAWRFKVKVWIGGDIFETQWRATTHNDGRAGLEPLYTTPPAPKRQPLTDEQITAIVREAAKGSAVRRDGSTSHRIARAIERAHGIGGEA